MHVESTHELKRLAVYFQDKIGQISGRCGNSLNYSGKRTAICFDSRTATSEDHATAEVKHELSASMFPCFSYCTCMYLCYCCPTKDDIGAQFVTTYDRIALLLASEQ